MSSGLIATDTAPEAAATPAAVSGAIARAFGDELSAFLRRRVGDVATADDLLQEVFLRVHGRAHQIRDEERVAGWVFRIARNVVADHYRRGDGRDARRSAGDVALSPLERTRGELELGRSLRADPEAEELAAGDVRLAQWLAAVVERLPEHYREAIRLVELEGVPQREAAERLGLSRSGLKSRVQRGRALLRRELERCCDVELDRRGRPYDYKARSGRSGCSGC